MNYLLFVFSTLLTLFVLSSLGFLLIFVILNYLFLAFPFFVWIIIAMVAASLSTLKLVFPPPLFLIILLPLSFSSFQLNLSYTQATFYRPPSNSSSSGIFSSLQSVLESLPHSISLNLILLGDFNVDFSSPSSSLNLINSISDLFSLNQIVSQPTHFSVSNSPSLIDLVFIPASLPHYSCNVLPPISNSDHNSILLSLPLPTVTPPPSSTASRRVWLYNSADFSLTNKFLSSIPWNSILFRSDVNSAWLTFKFTFLQIIHLTIPSKLVSAPSHPPWITCSFLSHIKHCNSLFKRTKLTNSPLLWSAYRSYRNKSLSYCRSLKAKFFRLPQFPSLLVFC